MKKTKLRISNDDPRGINRTLFGKPFNPSVNFALEDPLLLSCHPAVQKEGLCYTTYFGSNSPLSSKAPEFLKKKGVIESTFSELIGMEKTIILPSNAAPLAEISKTFLSGQIFFVPDSIPSPFSPLQTIYFSHGDLSSLLGLLETTELDHLPVVYLPKICPVYGRVNFSFIKELKEKNPFFLIIEDSHTFGLEGLNGFCGKKDTKNIDLLITHIPKTFGKMLCLLSGKGDFLNTLIEYSFSSVSLFPSASYLGMLNASLNIIESLGDRRETLVSFSKRLAHTFSSASLYPPLLTFHLNSKQEKEIFTKSLVDKGFLLPASSFKDNDTYLTFHINYLLEEKSIHSIVEIKNNMKEQIICESI